MRWTKPWVAAFAPGLALGIGAGALACAWSLVDVLTKRPPDGVKAAHRVVSLPTISTFGKYIALRDALGQITLSGFKRAQAQVAQPGHSDGWQATVECGTQNYFDVLSPTLQMGRAWSSPIDSGQLVAVVSHDFWRRFLASEGRSLGTVLQVNGVPYQIIGVTSAGFGGLRSEPADLFLPIEADPEVCLHRGRDLASGNWLTAFGRLAPVGSFASAADELARQGETGPVLVEPLPTARLSTIRQDVSASRVAAMSAMALLCLALCNVIGLQTLRALERRSEVAIRIQLGASRFRIFRSVLAEQVPLAVVCCAVSVAVVVALASFLEDVYPAMMSAVVWGPRSLLFMLGATAVSTLITSTLVAWSVASMGFEARVETRTASRRTRGSVGLIGVQVAIAVFLTAVGTSTVRSISILWSGAGFDVRHLLLVSGDPLRDGYRNALDVADLFDNIHKQLTSLPGITAVSISSADLLWATQSGDPAYVKSSPSATSVPGVGRYHAVTGEYLRTVGSTLIRGRWWTSDDVATALVMVVDESLARTVWHDQDPVGKCAFMMRDVNCIRVIGIARTRRAQALLYETPEVFVPLEQTSRIKPGTGPRTLMVNDSGGVSLPSVQEAVTNVTRRLGFPPLTVQRVADFAGAQSRPQQLAARSVGLFGLLGIAIGAIGIWASLGFVVSRRTREIGIRTALGAPRSKIVLEVCRPVWFALMTGAMCGCCLLFAAQGTLRAVLFGVGPLDPGSLILSVLSVMVAGALACVSPIIRASGVEPAVALRD